MFLRDKSIDGFPEIDRRFTRLLKLKALQDFSPTVKMIIGGIPVLGNLIQLYNAVNGHDIMTGDKLGCAGRTLAAISSLPGASIFNQVLGSSKSKAIQNIVNAAIYENIFKAIEKTSLSRDIAGWLTTDTAKMSYEGMLPDGEIKEGFITLMTGGC